MTSASCVLNHTRAKTVRPAPTFAGVVTLPKATRKKVRYVRSGRTLTLVVTGARTSTNDHKRSEWTRKIVGRLDRRGVKILYAQL